MTFKSSFTWWWLAATLACCLATYVAYPNDHSILTGLVGLLFFSFLLYVALRVAVAGGKALMNAIRRNKR